MLILLLPISIVAQPIKVIDLETNDILFNKYDDKIYATTPSTAGVNGNSICIIDPVTALIDTAIFIGSEPNKIVLSDNGNMIYVSLDGAAAIRSFDLTTLSAGQQYSLGNDPWSGPFYVEDLEILQGSDSSVVVSRRNQGFSPKHEGVGVYDSGTIRPNTTQDHTGSNVIEIISPELMVGYNNETTEFGLRTIQIDSNGLQEINVYQNMISGFGVDIYYSKDRIYSTNGKVIDISSGTPSLLATFMDASGPVIEDTSLNLICYAYQDFWSDEVLVKRYSKSNFVIQDTILISDTLTTGDVLSIITWGINGKLAFNTSGGKVVIIDQSVVGISKPIAKINFKIFPNPTVDFITITSQNRREDSEIQLITLSGEVVTRKYEVEFPHTIDLTNHASGTYLLLVTSGKNTGIQKIIKQ